MAVTAATRARSTKRTLQATSLAITPGTPARYLIPPPRPDARYGSCHRYFHEAIRSTWPSRDALVVYVAVDTPPLMVAALVAAVEQLRASRPDRLVVFREANAAGEWVPTLLTQRGRLLPYAPGAPALALRPVPPGFRGRTGRRYLPLVSDSPLGAGLVGPAIAWDALHLETTAQVRCLLDQSPAVGLVLNGPVRSVLAAAAVVPATYAARVTLTVFGRWTVPVLECDPVSLTG